MAYEMIDEQDGLLFVMTGTVDFMEVTQANAKAWAHPE